MRRRRRASCSNTRSRSPAKAPLAPITKVTPSVAFTERDRVHRKGLGGPYRVLVVHLSRCKLFRDSLYKSNDTGSLRMGLDNRARSTLASPEGDQWREQVQSLIVNTLGTWSGMAICQEASFANTAQLPQPGLPALSRTSEAPVYDIFELHERLRPPTIAPPCAAVHEPCSPSVQVP